MTGGHYTALFDANVLYPAPMRDILLQLTMTDIFRGRWTKDIHEEWINALMRNEPHRNRKSLERTRNLMDQSTRDCLIEGYESLIPVLELPDENDRHVLAAAITGRCDVIVTQNIKDFPRDALLPYGIETQHPDDFLINQLDISPGLFCACIRKIRRRLKNPPLSIRDYLDVLVKQNLVATTSSLEQYADQL